MNYQITVLGVGGMRLFPCVLQVVDFVMFLAGNAWWMRRQFRKEISGTLFLTTRHKMVNRRHGLFSIMHVWKPSLERLESMLPRTYEVMSKKRNIYHCQSTILIVSWCALLSEDWLFPGVISGFNIYIPEGDLYYAQNCELHILL